MRIKPDHILCCFAVGFVLIYVTYPFEDRLPERVATLCNKAAAGIPISTRIRDTWGQYIQVGEIRRPDGVYKTVRSSGPDMTMNTSDDIWEERKVKQ